MKNVKAATILMLMVSSLMPMHNTESKENVEQKKRRRLLSWFGSLSLTSQVGLILLSLSAVAFAAGILWNSNHKTIAPPKEKWIEAEITGVAESYDSIRPGDSVSATPAIRNDGDIYATAFIKMTIPKMSDGKAAYDYSVNDNWMVVQSDDEGDNIEIVYAYVSDGTLTSIAPAGVTDELCDGLTLKSDITGAEFYAMDIAIELDGYLVDAEQGDDPDVVWAKLGQ